MSYEHILLTQRDGIVRLTFNRPESRNAMTPAMGEEVVRAVEEIRNDADARVLILTGSGKSFSSGGDLAMLARDTGAVQSSEGPTMAGSPRDFYSRYLSIRSLPIPTIAAINGHAIGAGLCISLACDMRVAADDAKMGMTFARLAIHPGMGGTYLLPRLVGTALACELFFTGRVFDAAEAERMGIVNRTVPRAELETTVDQLAADIAGSGPIAVRMCKRAVYRGVEHSLEDMIEYEALNQAATFRTADAREGVQAIMEKRTPKFTGR